MNPLTQSKNTTILTVLIALTLACFALAPHARAVCREGCDDTCTNTFLGDNALINNDGGLWNTGIGSQALVSNTTGGFNTATGHFALLRNTTGSFNIALGENAGSRITTGSNNIDIGNAGRAGEANTIRIGTLGAQTKTFIAGIRGVAIGNANAIAVLIDSAGQLGTASSSRRFKKEIKPMDSNQRSHPGS